MVRNLFFCAKRTLFKEFFDVKPCARPYDIIGIKNFENVVGVFCATPQQPSILVFIFFSEIIAKFIDIFPICLLVMFSTCNLLGVKSNKIKKIGY